MFGFGKNKKKKTMVSPVTGKSILVTECQDPVFSEKVLGDGVALVPTENEIYSPCDGKIIQVAHSLHAVGIETPDGLEVLLHLGMDTVKLDGEGFKSFVKVGDTVKAGQKILEMDVALIGSKGFRLESPCIITNMDKLKTYHFNTGDVKHGESVIIEYEL